MVQRYGLEVDGGAELYCRWLAENLSENHLIEVVTTCARDYVSWENYYPEGSIKINNVPVHRCPVKRVRNIVEFNKETTQLLNSVKSRTTEINWLKSQGPLSPGIIRFLKREQDRFDVILFFTYLYYPTVIGSYVSPAKSVLVPTAHDEPVADLSLFHELYSRVRGLLFLTREEEAFVYSKYAPSADIPASLIGTGITVPESSINPTDWIEKHDLKKPIILYIGRIEAGKGCLELISYIKKAVQTEMFSGTLVLAGRNYLSEPQMENIRFLGFIPDNEIRPAIEASDIIIVPSSFESLSILLLQGFLLGKPAIVNGKSKVLLDHCLRSNAGLCYDNEAEFMMELDLILSKPDLRNQLSINAMNYIQNEFRWDLVKDRFEKFLELFDSKQ